MDVNDSIHFSMIAMPKGAEATITDRDFTIATISAPSSLRSKAETDEAEEGAEGEEGVEATDAEGEDSTEE